MQVVICLLPTTGINQDDVMERNHQAGLMRTIYSTAKNVVVWFGESFGDEGLALRRYPGRGNMFGPMLILLNKPYWTRMWIIQKFLLAQSVQIWCGGHCSDLNEFTRVFSEVYYRRRSTYPCKKTGYVVFEHERRPGTDTTRTPAA
jgi:hypothetical protein